MITRVTYSPVGSATQTSTIKMGRGDWEITSLSIIMGSTIPSLNGAEFGSGTVAFEILEGDGATVISRHFLMNGRFTRNVPMVMDSSKRVKGPGRIRATIEHGSSTDHTLTAIYRRVRD